MQTLLITGSLAYDHVMKFDGIFSNVILPEKLEKLSVSFRVDGKEVHFGGCAGNIAYNLALLEEKPVILGVAGNDFAEYKTWLEGCGIDTGEIIEIPDKSCSTAYIMTDRKGNQITSFYAGASEEEPTILLENYKDSDAVILISPDKISRMLHYIDEARRLNIPYIFDPGQQLALFEHNDLRTSIESAKGVIVNEYELHLLKEKSNLTEEDIYKQAEFLITTLGEKGSRIDTKDEYFQIPIALPQKILDPTGCGDAYRAGILKGLKSGFNWEKTGRLAALMSTYTIENIGTQNHRFKMIEFRQRFQEIFAQKL